MEYTPEQLADISKRQEEVIAFLKEKQLSPAIQMSMNNLGNDNFAIRPVVFLNDLKYTPEVKADKEVAEAEVKEPKSALEQANDIIKK